MIKGVYNENDFYVSQYWATKFEGELKEKTLSIGNFDKRAEKLKSLSENYWSLIESKYDSQTDKDKAFLEFYSNVLSAIGYNFKPKNRLTTDGAYYSLAAEVQNESGVKLLAALTSNQEEGSFESTVLKLLDLDLKESYEERDFSEIISEEFNSEIAPRWLLVGSIDNLFLLERNKWAFGRYIKINWSEVFVQKDKEVYEIILGLVSSEVLVPSTGNSAHDEFDDNSHRHAFAVTTELREGVREAIELLINEMIYAKREAHEKYLKKEDEANLYAKELSHDALFYVYRLIFMLFLEAQGEDSDLLPLKSEIYRQGYSLEKLLELVYKKLDETEFDGTFLQESLDKIFQIIYFGYSPQKTGDLLTEKLSSTGFLVKGLKSDLFDENKVKHLKGVNLRNGVLQKILKKLSTTKDKKTKRIARVSYANLGINQLGAVYEGLLSYTGFFAKEELFELKSEGVDPNKEPDKVYLAPKSLVDTYLNSKDKKYKLDKVKHFVINEDTGEPLTYKKGTFIFRMAGRDRQKLASYYTPESLTKCTVKYSLKVLFENKKTLDELWSIKILEPAMGSGAFLNEAVNQIADRILELEVKAESTKLKTPKDRQKRLWNIKYYLISNNVYGVDLNPTAIELARFSLWLNCIGAGQVPPNFVGKLKVGNSLIGARFKKNADGIYPWIMLDPGMVNYGKRFKDYSVAQYEKLEIFRKKFHASQISGVDPSVKKIQKKAQEVFESCINSADQDEKNEAYRKLKACADLWCTSFFVNADEIEVYPNSHRQLLTVFDQILDSGVEKIDRNLFDLVGTKCAAENFFHWEIEFANEINNGGFDLILGNPPWLAIEWQDSFALSDKNVIPSIMELNAAETRDFIVDLNDASINKWLSREYVRIEGYSNLLDVEFYHLLAGVQKNTYKAFDVLGLGLMSSTGSFGVIQEDGIFEDKQAAKIRNLIYRKMRFHFQFLNERDLFSEVAHTKRYSVNIFSSRDSDSFDHIGNLFLPSTIEDCYATTKRENLGGIKNEKNEWNTLGDSTRVIAINATTLQTFSKFLGQDSDSIFLNLYSNDILEVVMKINEAARKSIEIFKDNQLIGSECFHEVGAQDNGVIQKKPSRAATEDCVILSGPNISTSNPFFQSAKLPYTNKSSYDEVNLEELSDQFIPNTVYQPKMSLQQIDKTLPFVESTPYRKSFKVVCKGMLNLGIERTLYSAILPPGFCHINGLKSCASLDIKSLVLLAGYFQSIFYDFIVRIKNKTNFFTKDFSEFPVGGNDVYFESIQRRVVSLNALTKSFNELWLLDLQKADSLANNKDLTGYGKGFKKQSPLRDSIDRKIAMAELDVLVGLSYGLELSQIETVFSVYFSVLAEYDRKSNFKRREIYKSAYEKFTKRGY